MDLQYPISAVVAMSLNKVIGRDGDLPWRLPGDLRRFKELTMGKVVIMGRKTWESLPGPLKGRFMIVVTRDPVKYKHLETDTLIFVSEVDIAILAAHDIIDYGLVENEEIMVIGGSSIYEAALPFLNRIYATVVPKVIKGDTYFPFSPLRLFTSWNVREAVTYLPPGEGYDGACLVVVADAKRSRLREMKQSVVDWLADKLS